MAATSEPLTTHPRRVGPAPHPVSLYALHLADLTGAPELLGLAEVADRARHDEDRACTSHTSGRMLGASEMFAYLHAVDAAEVLALFRVEARRRRGQPASQNGS